MKDLFGYLQSIDVVEPVKDLINRRIYELTEEGKIKVDTWRHAERPWMLFNPCASRDCLRWNEVYHRNYRIVPKGCRHCWKVVHKMRNLAELFSLVKELQGMGLNAKCGVDRREVYGNQNACMAFWYAPLRGGLRAGRNLFKQVKDHLKAHYKGEDFHLILKRGCTEMEAMLPSDKWDEHGEEFDRIEEMLDQAYEIVRPGQHELEIQIPHTHANWIRWRAWAGDETYRLFTGGQSFFPGTVTYHESDHEESDYPGLGQEPLLKGIDS